MRVITHDGLFHADEVMACAILRLAGCCALFEIIRSRKEAAVAGPEAILVDVGGIYDPQNCRYDHHQKEFSVCRENGIPLASAGLVWRDFYTRVFRQMEISPYFWNDIFNDIDSKIEEIDALDNGHRVETTVGLSAVISSLNALDAFSEAQRIQFESAMDICYRWLYLQIRRAEQFHRDKYDAETVFCKSTDGIALFYKPNVAWKEVVSNYPDVKLVIYPSGSEWRIQTAPASKEDIFSMRCPAPEHWRGLRDVDIDGVHLVFCHKGGFIGGAITDDEALNIAFKWIELAK